MSGRPPHHLLNSAPDATHAGPCSSQVVVRESGQQATAAASNTFNPAHHAPHSPYDPYRGMYRYQGMYR